MNSAAYKARKLIWERDGYRCVYCGDSLLPGRWSIDHVVPVSAGGTSKPTNLVSACWTCNRVKYTKRLPDKHKPAVEAAVAKPLPSEWSEEYERALDKRLVATAVAGNSQSRRQA